LIATDTGSQQARILEALAIQIKLLASRAI
jgi:hypothetical protein